jgi:hypothetical protein
MEFSDFNLLFLLTHGALNYGIVIVIGQKILLLKIKKLLKIFIWKLFKILVEISIQDNSGLIC